MRKIFLLLLVAGCSCKKSGLGGLIADVTLGANAKATCADVRVKDSSGMELDKKLIAFGGKTTLRIGIGSDDYPRDVTVSVRATWSSLPVATTRSSS